MLFRSPYFRYELLDPNLDAADDKARMYIYGLNVRLAQVMFLKGELNTTSAGNANDRFEGQGYTEFKAAVVVGF